MTDVERLREQAERCKRLARGTTDQALAQSLRDLASQYMERAIAIEQASSSQAPYTPSQDQTKH